MYKYIETKKSYQAAADYCDGIGGQLAQRKHNNGIKTDAWVSSCVKNQECLTLNIHGKYKINDCSELKSFVCQRSKCSPVKIELIDAPDFISFNKSYILAKPRKETDRGVWLINIKRTHGNHTVKIPFVIIVPEVC